MAGVPALAADAPAADGSAFPGLPMILTQDMWESKESIAQPAYPIELRRKGLCGDVLIAVKVGKDGRVLDTKIVKSEPPNVFDAAVKEAVIKSRYKRVVFSGEPVIYQTRSPFQFRISDANCVPAAAVPAASASTPVRAEALKAIK
jgi:protein TonB